MISLTLIYTENAQAATSEVRSTGIEPVMTAAAAAVSRLILTVALSRALGVGSFGGEFHNSLAAVLTNLGR